MEFEDLFLKTFVNGIEIDIHRGQFDTMFELAFYGVSHIYDEPIIFKRFKLSTSIFYFVINLIEDKKLPTKAR